MGSRGCISSSNKQSNVQLKTGTDRCKIVGGEWKEIKKGDQKMERWGYEELEVRNDWKTVLVKDCKGESSIIIS